MADAPATAAAGRKAPVMTSVARLAGVSQKTVSRVVNDEPNVSQAVRTRVLAAIDELGYRPNSVARALVTRRTHLVSLVTFGSPLYGPSATMMAVIRAARRAGYALSIETTREDDASEIAAAVTQALDSGAEGLILAEPVASVVIDAPRRLGVPMVVLGETASELGYSTAGHEVRAGAALATNHLLGLGHRTVHHLSGPLTWQTSRERLAGWRDALDAAGIAAPPPVEGDWSAAAGYRLARGLLADPSTTALFVANDQMAMGVLRACGEADRSVPRDLSVVGYDDVPEAAYQMVPLTTVRQEFDDIADRAVAHLIDLIEGRASAPLDIRVPMTLIVRSSTAAPRGGSPSNPRTEPTPHPSTTEQGGAV